MTKLAFEVVTTNTQIKTPTVLITDKTALTADVATKMEAVAVKFKPVLTKEAEFGKVVEKTIVNHFAIDPVYTITTNAEGEEVSTDNQKKVVDDIKKGLADMSGYKVKVHRCGHGETNTPCSQWETVATVGVVEEPAVDGVISVK